MFKRVLNVLVNANARTRVAGSSTACFVFLRGSTLHGCNLGDSGFMVIRDGKVFFKTPQQQVRRLFGGEERGSKRICTAIHRVAKSTQGSDIAR